MQDLEEIVNAYVPGQVRTLAVTSPTPTCCCMLQLFACCDRSQDSAATLPLYSWWLQGGIDGGGFKIAKKTDNYMCAAPARRAATALRMDRLPTRAPVAVPQYPLRTRSFEHGVDTHLLPNTIPLVNDALLGC